MAPIDHDRQAAFGRAGAGQGDRVMGSRLAQRLHLPARGLSVARRSAQRQVGKRR
jgi:hypothetical protein